MRLVLLVVRIEFLPDRDHASVHGVRLFTRHFDHDRLLHLVGDDDADQFLVVRHTFFGLGRGFRHYFFSVFALGFVLALVILILVFVLVLVAGFALALGSV